MTFVPVVFVGLRRSRIEKIIKKSESLNHNVALSYYCSWKGPGYWYLHDVSMCINHVIITSRGVDQDQEPHQLCESPQRGVPLQYNTTPTYSRQVNNAVLLWTSFICIGITTRSLDISSDVPNAGGRSLLREILLQDSVPTLQNPQ